MAMLPPKAVGKDLSCLSSGSWWLPAILCSQLRASWTQLLYWPSALRVCLVLHMALTPLCVSIQNSLLINNTKHWTRASSHTTGPHLHLITETLFLWEFPGGPVVKTPCTFAVECLSSILAGELRGHKPHYMARRQKKKRKRKTISK